MQVKSEESKVWSWEANIETFSVENSRKILQFEFRL